MLQKLDTDLWTATTRLRFLGIQVGARMTVVRLGSGGLLLHAPIELTPALRAELDALGPVQAIVAPNAMHHLYLPKAVAAYPRAQVFAAEGVAGKHPELKDLHPLGEAAELLWGGDLEQHPLHGAPALNEVAFFHRASRTLILTDWLFNFRRAPSLLTWLYMKLAGAIGRPVQTRELRSMIKDRAAAAASLDQVLAWDFDRIVLSHHDVVERDGKQALRDATAWLRS